MLGANIARILLHPSGFYDNIHTTSFSGGEIRGHLETPPTACPGDLDDRDTLLGA